MREKEEGREGEEGREESREENGMECKSRYANLR
jgi:hypothetical protein